MSQPMGASWKKEYLRILVSGPASKDDWVLAKELIVAKYGDGDYFPVNPITRNAITNLIWRGVTVEGRLFADRLAEEIHRASRAYRIKAAAFIFASWLAGVLTQSLASILAGLFS